MTRKLLLADDSITIQKVVELVLAEEGFEIKAVNNGEEALAAVSSFNPDIVLADIEMPKMNGYQLSEKIKTNPATQGIPVILLSGAFEPLDEELARQVKADSFVIKPFESQELISKINASLSGSATPVEEAAVVFEEEPIAVAETAGEGEEVFAEAVSADEDLWSMEPLEGVPVDAALAETTAEEVVAAEVESDSGVSVAEAFGMVEEAPAAEVFIEPEMPVVAPEPVRELRSQDITPPVAKAVPPAYQDRPVKMPEISMPSKEEFSAMFKKTVDERVSAAMAGMDIKGALLSSISPLLKDSIEKILWEVAPELTEKLLKEILQSSLASLNKEIEKVIWETVPEVAETMISKEIAKIKSEI